MSARPLAVLIGGWGYVSAELDPLAHALSNHFEVVSFSGEDLLSRDVFVSELNQVQRDHPGRKCLLVGWSLGAMLILDRLSDLVRIDAVALVAGASRFCLATQRSGAGKGSPSNGTREAKGGSQPNGESQSGGESQPNRGLRGVPEASVRAMKIGCRRQPNQTLIDFYQQSATPYSLDLATAEQMAANRLNADSPTLGDGLEYLRQFDVVNRVSEIQIPMLILHGRQDQVVHVTAADELGDLFPSATTNIHPEAGHDLPIRSSVWVANSITDFWSP